MAGSRTLTLLLLAAALPVAGDAGAARAVRRAAPAAGAGVHGRVFEDRNADGVQEGGEPGVAGAALLLVDAAGAVRAETASGAGGDYTLPVTADGRTLVCVPPPGARPVGAGSRRTGVAGGATDFGVVPWVTLELAHGAPRCVVTGRLRERARDAGAGDDVDVIAGGDATSTDALAAWFNQYDRLPLFARRPDDARTAPNAVLSVALVPGAGGSVDVVTGTRAGAAGNLFTWRTRGGTGNAGHLPASFTQACRTRDAADVHALVATADGTLLAGTDGAQVERWARDAHGAWACTGRDAVSGAVVAFATAGRLVAVATDSAVLVVDPARMGAGDAVRWRTAAAGVRAIAAADVTGDGAADLVVARATAQGGALELWRNDSAGGRTSFVRAATVALTSAPTALAAADFGGTPGADVAVGLAGGVRVFWCDGGALPPRGSEAVRVDGDVTALAAGDLDPAGGAGDDLVVATRAGARGGAVLVLVRGPAGAALGAAIGR